MLARPMTAPRAARLLAAGAGLLPLAGCAYLRDRGRDFTDIVDVKGGVGGIGLGAKARATEFIGTGVGFGAVYDTTEKLGRPWYDNESAFVGLGFFAMDGQGGVCPGEGFEISFLGLRIQNETVQRPWSWFRAGGEIVLPGVRGGFFVNLGEFVDFLAGVATLDPVGDDGLEIGTSLEDVEAEERKKKYGSPPKDETPPPTRTEAAE